MIKMVSLQLSVAVVVALAALAVSGTVAGWSALLGGWACVLPNALFALRLAMQARSPGGANAASFLIGEFVKLALTVALLLAITLEYREINWLAFIIGLVVALKSYFVAFLFDRHL